MKNQGGTISIMTLAVVIACSFLIVTGCSKKEDEASRDIRKEQAVESAPADSYEADTETGYAVESDEAIVDEGAECATHQYLIKPGTSSTLKFEVHLKDKKLKETKVEELVIENDQWQDNNLTASLGFSSIEVVTAAYPVRLANGTEIYAANQETGNKMLTFQYGSASLRWREDGYAVVERLKHLGDAVSIGDLTDDAFIELNDGNITVTYFDTATQKSYLLLTEKGILEREEHILVFELFVGLPEKDTRMSKKSLMVKGGSTGWTITAEFDQIRQQYRINGPGEAVACYNSLE